MTDKNLFMYDLAIVAIMKNAAHYIKEWLDYHLLAGVDHFYIYDNESEDNFKEILQPYIDNNIVTYIFYPGKFRQMEAYNDAIKNFKFSCRYMSFVDDDEFIFPQNNRDIKSVVDEFMAIHPNISGLDMRWSGYGSNFHEKADYSKGVLDRFTRRGKLSDSVKTILNPRRVNFMATPHYANFFETAFSLHDFNIQIFPDIKKSVSDEIIMNHYHFKSREEYELKHARGYVVAHIGERYTDDNFEKNQSNGNKYYDDSIIKYRDAKLSEKNLNGGGWLEKFAPLKQPDYNKILSALIQNLSQTFGKNIYPATYQNKMETFLTCFAVSKFFRNNTLNEQIGKSFEEASLNAIYNSPSLY